MTPAEHLTNQTREAIRKADVMIKRDSAVCELCALIDPDKRLSTNGRAETLAAALRRFEGAAWRRISKGYLKPGPRMRKPYVSS